MRFITTCILACLLRGGVAFSHVHHRLREPATNTAIEARIIGGTEVQPGDLPFLVGILGGMRCGGTLVNARTVVTAASCVSSGGMTSSDVQVVAGNVDIYAGSKVGVARIPIHPEYNETFSAHDIAILRLADDIEESDSTGYAKLPNQNTLPIPKTEGILAGWGATVRDSYLPAQKASRINLPILPKEGCGEVYDPAYEPEGIFCVRIQELRDACFGDNGSPLVSAVTGNSVGVLTDREMKACGGRSWRGVTWPIVSTSVDGSICYSYLRSGTG